MVPGVTPLEKNNLACVQLLIFQPLGSEMQGVQGLDEKNGLWCSNLADHYTEISTRAGDATGVSLIGPACPDGRCRFSMLVSKICAKGGLRSGGMACGSLPKGQRRLLRRTMNRFVPMPTATVPHREIGWSSLHRRSVLPEPGREGMLQKQRAKWGDSGPSQCGWQTVESALMAGKFRSRGAEPPGGDSRKWCRIQTVNPKERAGDKSTQPRANASGRDAGSSH